MKKIVVMGYLPKEIWNVLSAVNGATFVAGYHEKKSAVIFTELVHDSRHPDYYNQKIALRSAAFEEKCPCMYRDMFSDGYGRVADIRGELRIDVATVPFDIVKLDAGYREAFELADKQGGIQKVNAKICFPEGTTVKDRNFWTREYSELMRFLSDRDWLYTTVFDEDEEFVVCGQGSGIDYEFSGSIGEGDEKLLEISFEFFNGSRFLIHNCVQEHSAANVLTMRETYLNEVRNQVQNFVDSLP
ncbi:MAG: hypothetical protein LBR70_01845 [Lactobacillaceae bacterium]|jgi:hypothetical protein|nr:hypothetical protein [Lactobacillaceae bacterium]